MKMYMKNCLVAVALSITQGAMAVTVAGTFTGKGLLTDFRNGGSKTKVEVSFELDDSSGGIMIINGGQTPGGSKSYSPPYLYVIFPDSEGTFAGRLQIKGPVGKEKSLSGTLHRAAYGFTGNQELKVNLKRVQD